MLQTFAALQDKITDLQTSLSASRRRLLTLHLGHFRLELGDRFPRQLELILEQCYFRFDLCLRFDYVLQRLNFFLFN